MSVSMWRAKPNLKVALDSLPSSTLGRRGAAAFAVAAIAALRFRTKLGRCTSQIAVCGLLGCPMPRPLDHGLCQ